MPEHPLVNLGEISKPATVLIEKISDAIGGVFRPYQIVRVAKAEAEVDRIRAESQIQITDLQRRAMSRFFAEEGKKQSNIEDITRGALPLLEVNSTPQDLEDDWIINFFDKCRLVSDKEMQKLWSRLLAGEANAPGVFSKRTVNLLADLDKSDADLFTRFCGFCWNLGEPTPMIFDSQGDIYNKHGIHFDSLNHMDTLGLVKFNNISGFRILKLPKKIHLSYFGQAVDLTFPKDAENDLKLGKALLTKAGVELSRVCGSQPVEGFYDFIYEKWVQESYVPAREELPQGKA